MSEILNNLVAFSNKYGQNPELVLAGGGNTSAKKDGRMFVKGSGTRLATITADGFVEIDLEKLNLIFTKSYPESDDEREAEVLSDLMNSRCEGNENKRPSVETTLHALFNQTYVLHLHPALVNGLTCSNGGEKLAVELFGDGIIWVDACRPGYILAKICRDKMLDYKSSTGKDADIIILQNHGIFIADNDVAGLGNKLENVMSMLKSRLKVAPALTPAEGIDSSSELSPLCGGFCSKINTVDSERFSTDEESASVLMRPFTPDHIVYCKAYPLYIANNEKYTDAISGYKVKFGFLPRVIIFQGSGIYCCGDSEKVCNTAKLLFEDALKIAVYTQSFGGALHMTQELTDFIVNWEVESYRSSQSK